MHTTDVDVSGRPVSRNPHAEACFSADLKSTNWRVVPQGAGLLTTLARRLAADRRTTAEYEMDGLLSGQ